MWCVLSHQKGSITVKNDRNVRIIMMSLLDLIKYISNLQSYI